MRFSRILLLSLLYFFGVQLVQAQQTITGYYVDINGINHKSTFKFLFDQEDYKEFVVLNSDQERKVLADSVIEVGFDNGRIFQSEILP
jgi:hypothetical protein